jgi:hypothetical protein|tara:strand:- start:303 stop:782 length:480 start_codon:yes stop_codon:yes gene_type:complete
MGYTLTHIYDDYQKNVEDSVDSTTFKNICSDFNMEVIDYILEGKDFNMGYNLSTLSIVRMKRDPRAPRVDWAESNKYKQELKDLGERLYDKETGEGTKWQIYFTDDSYYKYYWRKGKCAVPNKSVYRFDATRGLKGNKEKLTRILKKDELAYLKFKKYK